MSAPRVVVAPDRPQWSSKSPIIFLAGPIVGARRWQDEVIAAAPDGDYIIFTPRRQLDRMEDFPDWAYKEQVEWETDYLRRAGRRGAILFWLAKEERHFCERAYAQTTRFELGEWLVRSPTRLAVGIEEGFPGGRYIRKRFEKLDLKTYVSLPETIAAAVEIVNEDSQNRV